MAMHIAVVGGRDFDDYRMMADYLDRFQGLTTIVTAGARGADTLADRATCMASQKDTRMLQGPSGGD